MQSLHISYFFKIFLTVNRVWYGTGTKMHHLFNVHSALFCSTTPHRCNIFVLLHFKTSGEVYHWSTISSVLRTTSPSKIANQWNMVCVAGLLVGNSIIICYYYFLLSVFVSNFPHTFQPTNQKKHNQKSKAGWLWTCMWLDLQTWLWQPTRDIRQRGGKWWSNDWHTVGSHVSSGYLPTYIPT